MELYIYSPTFGLPSYDPRCLASLCQSPTSSPTGVLPSLKVGTIFISGLFNIIQYLQEKGHNLKGQLNPIEEGRAYSLSLYLDSKLSDILVSFFRYVDENNYLSSTRPELAKVLPFVERYYLPYRLKDEATALLEKKKIEMSRFTMHYLLRSNDDKALHPLEANIMKIGRNLMKEISSLIKGNTYIFGSKLHYLDIITCCHLAHIFKVKAPNQRLADYTLFTYPELFAYVDRVMTARNLDKIHSTSKAAPSAWGAIPLLWYKAKNFFECKEKTDAPVPTPEEKALIKTRAYSLIIASFSLAFYVVYHGLITSGEEVHEELEDYSDITDLDDE
ncbi:hypothetical protein DSO57_1012683 [Entomophthora muscae]|uniref:Uncharacterized protein n=1 Tax=Entomophthora muscae TaxID=34485 RepID=A0ACC2TSX3_9FUNG|nr:hypothetical protein DSO57_1012683 [Entomophthora muscae]